MGEDFCGVAKVLCHTAIAEGRGVRCFGEGDSHFDALVAGATFSITLLAVLVPPARRRVEHRYRMAGGTLRVIVHGPTFEGVVRTALGEIRRNAQGTVGVPARLPRTPETVAG